MKRSHRGMALLEVIVATVWVSLTIAALWRWQARASALDAQARQRLTAAHLMTQLSEHLHALRAHSSTAIQVMPSAWAWSWGSPIAGGPSDCWQSACAAPAWQAASLSAWRHAVRTTLPKGDSQVQPLQAAQAADLPPAAHVAYGLRVSLRWRISHMDAIEASTADASEGPPGWACLSQTLLF